MMIICTVHPAGGARLPVNLLNSEGQPLVELDWSHSVGRTKKYISKAVNVRHKIKSDLPNLHNLRNLHIPRKVSTKAIMLSCR